MSRDAFSLSFPFSPFSFLLLRVPGANCLCKQRRNEKQTKHTSTTAEDAAAPASFFAAFAAFFSAFFSSFDNFTFLVGCSSSSSKSMASLDRFFFFLFFFGRGEASIIGNTCS